MRRYFKNVAVGSTAVLLLSIMCAVSAQAPKVKYKIGDKVADFALKDDQGRSVRLSQYRGMIVVLNFYASW